MYKSESIMNLKRNLEEVKLLLNSGLLDEAKIKLDSFNIHNEDYYSLYSNYYYLCGDYQSGISLLEKAKQQIPFSFEILYNLATLKSVIGAFEESLELFASSGRIAVTKEDREGAVAQLKQILSVMNSTGEFSLEKIQKYYNQVEKILNEGDERTYPINRFSESLVKETIKNREGELYFTEMYKAFGIYNVDNTSRYFFKNEILPGEVSNSYKFTIEGKTTLPIAVFTDCGDIQVVGPSGNFVFPENTLTKNQYNYYTFEEAGEYTISSEKLFFVSNPIDLLPQKRDTQVIVSLFVDGLANTVIENNLEELMPNTYKFFSRGYINNNCYTSGDWTLPSVSAIYTGKTTINHGLYHPTNHFELNKYNRLFTEDFKEQGYLTAQINNDWRVTPTYGYIQGMDRIVYQNSLGGFWAGEVVTEAIEHLETFKENNHFLWVSFMDLHDVADEINNDLMSQVHLPSQYRQKKNLGPTSVLSEFDTNKIEKYDVELKRIDLHLSSLLNYLENTFGMENILVSLISDHGQTYLKEEDFLLHEPKRKVPLMLAGGNIKPQVSNELCSIIDIVPTIASITEVSVDPQEGRVLKDFGGEGREFALTETLHPNQPYLVAITDDEHIFRFKTIKDVSENTLIDLEYYEAKILDKNDLMDVTEENKEKLEKYCNMVIERASKLQM